VTIPADLQIARAGRDDFFDAYRENAPGHEAAEGDQAHEAPPAGPLLSEPDERVVFEMLEDDIQMGEPLAGNQHEEIKRNRAWREGKRFVRLEMKLVQDRAVYKFVDHGRGYTGSLPNKVDDLCRKIVAQVTVDPPEPEPSPRSGDDADVQSAEYAGRFLSADGDASRTNDAAVMFRALDTAMTDKSAFIYLCVNEAARWRPKTVLAAPAAVDPKQPTMVPAGPSVDPMTGAPMPPQVDPMTGQPPLVPYDGELVTRWVDEGVTRFVANPAEAGRQWEPGFEAEVVPLSRVRLHPPTAAGLEAADGVTLLLLRPFAWLERKFESVRSLSDADAAKLAAWEPKRGADLLPMNFKALRLQSRTNRKGQRPSPYALCWCYARYQAVSPEYPEGAYLYAADSRVFARGPWAQTVTGADGLEKVELLDLPLVQVRPKEDLQNGDYGGDAMIGLFAPGDEYRAQIMAGVLESLDQVLHPATFLSATSPIQPGQIQFSRETDTPIHVMNVQTDAPKFEEPRNLPAMALDLHERVTQEMDNASGLQQVAQGVADASVQSGIHAREVIEQSLVALGSTFRTYNDGYKRLWRLKLQLARAFFDVPQQVRYVGDDGVAMARAFAGSDFHGVEDVDVRRGTGTMMSATAKQAFVAALRMQYPGQISEADAYDMVLGNVAGIMGAQDNPHRTRVLRQISAWKDGPAGPGVNPFVPPLPVDTRLDVAAIRERELGRTMASTAFAKQDPAWQALLVAEYMRMTQALTPPPAGPSGPPTAPPPAPAGPGGPPAPLSPPPDSQSPIPPGAPPVDGDGQTPAMA